MKKQPIEREHCPTCNQALAREYKFHFSVLGASLLLAMAKEVRRSIAFGRDFTSANKVHVTKLGLEANIVNATTIASKLGLIAKYEENGRQISGHWVITARGWSALRGNFVPESVTVKSKVITQHGDKLTTLASALKTYPGSDYNPQDWYEIAEGRTTIKEY